MVTFGPIALGFGFHLRETAVIVGKLVQVRERDLARRDLIIVTYIGGGVATAVLELDFEPHPELSEVEPRSGPVDSDRLANRTHLCSENVKSFCIA